MTTKPIGADKGTKSNWFSAARAQRFMACALEVVQYLGEEQVRRLFVEADAKARAAGLDGMEWATRRPVEIRGLVPRGQPLTIADIPDYQVMAIFALQANAASDDSAPTRAMIAAVEYGKYLGPGKVPPMHEPLLPAPSGRASTPGRRLGTENSALKKLFVEFHKINKAKQYLDAKILEGVLPKADQVAKVSGLNKRLAAVMVKSYKDDSVFDSKMPNKRNKPAATG